jgi:uncharacterized membrane protein YfcA
MSVVGAIAIGLAAGVVAGMMGIGGGILLVPALAILLDHSQIEAEATSLVAIIPVALVGTWRQAHYENVRLSEGVLIGLLSPVGVVAGAVVANSLSQRALEIGFAMLMLFVAYRLVRSALGPTQELRASEGLSGRPRVGTD